MSRSDRGVLNDTRPANMNTNLGSGKMLPPSKPVMRSKLRALTNVAVNKDRATAQVLANKSGKIEADRLERQKENASRLASGLSVFKKSQISQDKENGQEVAPRKKSNSIVSLKPVARPQRPKKQQCAPPTLKNQIKSESLVSLLFPDEKEQTEVKELANKAEETTRAADIVDTDADYVNNEFILGAYAKDIYQFLQSLERSQAVRKEYLTSAHVMTGAMRSLLVDWLFEVKQSFKLLGETIQLAVGLLDRFMQDHPQIPKSELQLVGVTCIFIASKYEEIYPPDLEDLIDISAKSYTKSQILRMERTIFSSLDYQIGRPSPLHFLRRYGRVAKVDMLTYCFAKYFIDLAMVQYSMSHLLPSLLAAAALYLACYVTSDGASETYIWTPTLEFFSNYQWEEVSPVANQLAGVIWSAPNAKYQAVQKNYTDPKKMMGVSKRFELKSDRLRVLAFDSKSKC